MKKTAKIHEEKEEEEEDEEEEEKGRGVWDCGSPLYDSHELVSLASLIERHLMEQPSLGRSKRVAAATTAAAAAAAAAVTTQVSRPPIVISASSRSRLAGNSNKLPISSSMAGLVGKKKKEKEKTKKYKSKFYGFCRKIGLLKNEGNANEKMI